MMRRFVSLLLVVSLLFSSFTPVHAQALPTRFAVAVGGVIERNFARLGFAANDPRIASTLTAVGVAANDSVFGVASGVGMVAAGVAGLPAWATVAIGLGIGALAFGAYKLLTSSSPGGIAVVLPATDPRLATNKPVSTEIGPRDVVCLPGQSGCTPSVTSFASDVPNRHADYSGFQHAVRNYGDAAALANADLTAHPEYYCVSSPCAVTSVVPVGSDINQGMLQVNYSGGQPGYSYMYDSANPAYVPTAPMPETVPGTLDQIAAQMPPVAMTTPIDPQSMADIANEALRRAAAQPGYSGVPVPLNQPITPQDVIDWGNLNPGKMPTAADVLAPLPNGVVMPAPSGSALPSPYPSPYPSPTPTPTPSDTFLPPGMENTPTASQILAPILGLLPDFRSYVTPSHAATCPTPSVDVFNKHLVLDAHCTLLDSPGVRQVLYGVMAAVWTIVAIFIILAA
jgi:hypothetical protein